MRFRIAPITAPDIAGILQIERRSFAQPWSRQAFVEELMCAQTRSYLLRFRETGSSIAAYICSRAVLNELHILKLAVDPRWRCRGVGTRLMEESLNLARQQGAETAYLEVRETNRAAISFYDKLGFRLIGRRPNYYSATGEDALMMATYIKEER